MKKKGGKGPEAQVGRCIRSKEKGLLDKYDGWQLAARHDRDTIYNIDMQR